MNKRILIIANSIVLLGIIVMLSLSWTGKKEETAYVDLTRVYNEFELKMELEAELESTVGARKRVLDSLEINLNLLAGKIRTSGLDQNNTDHPMIRSFMQEQQYYQQLMQQYSEDNEVLSAQYTEQIWNQLNQYVEDFGKAHTYTYILGSKGDGSIMYADEARDITEQVLNYVNEAYHGEK